VAWAPRATRRARKSSASNTTCVAYGQLGRQAEAAQSIEKLLELYPGYPDNASLRHRKYNFPEGAIEHSIEGRRKAGLDVPDESTAAN
jgi:hypothetical protein